MNLLLSRRALALVLPLALTMTACDTNEDDGTNVDDEASVYAVSNPTGSTDTVVRLSEDLASTEATFSGFTGVTNIQNVHITSDGDGYLTADVGSAVTPAGAIIYVQDLCDESGDEGCANANATIGAGSRVISGALTELVAPKGIINVEDRLVVADNGGNGAIRVFTQSASGNVAPLFSVTNLGTAAGARNVWDVAYDRGNDMLFVAATDGTVLVYDDFFNERGANGPARIITPSDAARTQISTNLHGIAFDDDTDRLVVTDVGGTLPTSGNDGQIFVIDDAPTASGNTPVRYQISGGTSNLGNPVDLALSEDGVVYVAEKVNGVVLRFNGVLTSSGTSTASAAASIPVPSAESVAVANE
ncbi:MAG TPA: hypothetical protein VF576_05005 [Rubricoccaceae bacterium]|jgi:hypothetical protein